MAATALIALTASAFSTIDGLVIHAYYTWSALLRDTRNIASVRFLSLLILVSIIIRRKLINSNKKLKYCCLRECESIEWKDLINLDE